MAITRKNEHKRHMLAAIHLAGRSNLLRHKTGAVMVSSGIYAYAQIGGWSHYSEFNLIKSHRTIHAEIHVILRTPQKAYLRDATIYIATVRNKSGNIGLARPCDQCLATLFEVGIKRAVFTVEGTDYDILEIN